MSDRLPTKTALSALLHCSSTPGQDGAVTQVEIDEVLGLCIESLVLNVPSRLQGTLPCVTKLPKFLPTMQCQVTPLRSSNCLAISLLSVIVVSVWRTVFLMWFHIRLTFSMLNFSMASCAVNIALPQLTDFDGFLLHVFGLGNNMSHILDLGCEHSISSTTPDDWMMLRGVAS
ncbi:hypothetical protein KCU59_g33, partial [Aureobasidium melanogenum]